VNHSAIIRIIGIVCLLASLGCIRLKHPVRFVSQTVNVVSEATTDVDSVRFEELLLQSREYGLLTDWNVLGPFGNGSPKDFDRIWQLERKAKPGRFNIPRTNRFQFADGAVRLSEESETGIYYAESAFELDSTGTWIIRLQTHGTLELFVDGKSAARKDTRSAILPEVSWHSVQLDVGKHQVLVKFLPSALPFRVAVLPPSPGPKRRPPPKAIHAEPDLEYQNAAVETHSYDAEL
jgi:hypothetical protein